MDIKLSSETLNLLIEKLSKAIGWYCEPKQIRRLAKADAEAKLISTNWILNLKNYMMHTKRKIHQGIKDEKNISNIILKCLISMKEATKADDVDDDWLRFFFEKAKMVSDEQMQDIWANLLSGELEKPGSFSKRTINLVELLDKSDAKLFTSLCSFGVYHGGSLYPLIIDYQNQVYIEKGLNFEKLQHLDNIGLINFDSIVHFSINIDGEKSYFSYFGMLFYLNLIKKLIMKCQLVK
ncbi:DUF2806 domain-containing protein [Legionella pneumophila]|nr:DUF2806 domain-containing protein [Legionella pneumophila]